MTFRIGLFDSGVGGLSVLQTLEHTFPSASFVYYADAAQFPFGSKSKAELLRLTSQAIAFLLSQQVDLIVIACHTASVGTLDILPKQFPIPIIGMVEPTLAALQKCKKKEKVGILATQATINSQLYEKLIGHTLISYACPELITLIEQGITPTPEEIRHNLKPLLETPLDVLILASTHLPHIQHQIEEELDAQTVLLNPAAEVAAAISPLVTNNDPAAPHQIFTTGSVENLEKFLKCHPLKRAYEPIRNVE